MFAFMNIAIVRKHEKSVTFTVDLPTTTTNPNTTMSPETTTTTTTSKSGTYPSVIFLFLLCIPLIGVKRRFEKS